MSTITTPFEVEPLDPEIFGDDYDADEVQPIEQEQEPAGPRQEAFDQTQILSQCLYEGRVFIDGELSQDARAAFLRLLTIIVTTPTEAWTPTDHAWLKTFDKLAAMIELADMPYFDQRAWEWLKEISSLLRATIRNASSLATQYIEPQQRLRDSIETLRELQVSPNQVADIYQWKTEKGFPDTKRAQAALDGKITVDESERIRPERDRPKVPSLHHARWLCNRIRQESKAAKMNTHA